MLMIPWARGWVPKHVGCWVLRNRNGLQIIIVQISSRSGTIFCGHFWALNGVQKL
jgi:hypothetical protein